jgi:formylmethanofuran dehydrogenase subunit E
MPRKPKVTAVPIEQELVNATEVAIEPKTDAEQMTDIINIVSTSGDAEPELVVEAPKARAKRAPSRSPSVRKPKIIEPEVEVTPTFDEVQVDVTYPVEAAPAAAKVECPDCGKTMSQKTLRYSHGPNCVVRKQQTAQSATNVIVEQEVRGRQLSRREERAARREAMVAKLVQNAF